jgi:hypothetical protein
MPVPSTPLPRAPQALERHEQSLSLVDRQADAGIDHAHLDVAIGHRPLHAHLPIGTVVLDGVAEQVEQHLLQPQRVGAHLAIERLAVGQLQLHRSLLRQRRHQGQALLDQRQQRHRADGHHQPPRFDAPEVEHVVDQPQQVAPAAQNLFGVLALLAGERVRGVRHQQLAEAEDRVHRRAQLVRHHRHEARFGAVGALGVVLGRGERLLRQLALGDVDAEQVVAAPAVGERRAGHDAHLEVEPRVTQAFREVPFDHHRQPLLHLRDAALDQLVALGAEHIDHRVTDDLLHRPPDQVGSPFIDVGVDEVVVDHGDVAREGVEQRAGVGFALARSVPGQLLGRDVARHEHHAAHAFHRLRKRRVRRLQVLRRGAGAVEHIAQQADALRAQAFGQSMAPLVRDRARQHVAHAATDHALAWQAGLPAPGVVDQAIHLVFADHADHVGDRVGHHLVGVQVGARRPVARTPPTLRRRRRRRLLAAQTLAHPRRSPGADVRTSGAARSRLQGSTCWPGTWPSRLACSINASSRPSTCGSRASSCRPTAGSGPRHCTSMRANGLGMYAWSHDRCQ